jgi:hypothetical protein
MVAIFFSEKMTPFLQNITAFPTIIFTIVLGVAALYWIVAVLGLADIDLLDLDMDTSDAGSGASDVLAGLLLRFGLKGVPLTLIISLVALIGWFICYYLAYLSASILPAALFRYLLGIPIFIGSLYIAVMITAQLIKPIRTLLEKSQQHDAKHILGQTAVVRTSRVDSTFGEATLNDGGAGLLLKVRSNSGSQFQKGDRVVLLEHNKHTNTYRVVSEQEFSGM